MLKIVTPLSRPENLVAIFNSIVWQFRGPADVHKKLQWDIVMDASVFSNGDKAKLIYQFQQLTEEYHWLRMLHSPIENSYVGHSHRNYYLDNYAEESDHIYFLDDDTLLHPDFYSTLMEKQYFTPENMAILFDQENATGQIRLNADPNKISVGNIDMGMYVINNKFTEGLRFEEDNYCADGVFIEKFLNKERLGNVKHVKYAIIHRTLSTYNKLRP